MLRTGHFGSSIASTAQNLENKRVLRLSHLGDQKRSGILCCAAIRIRIVLRLFFAVAVASLLSVGCATPPAKLPTAASFVVDIRAGRVNLETYDFARFWNQSRFESLLWLRDLQNRLQALEPDLNKGCGEETQRSYAAMMYLIMLTQASDAAVWSTNVNALRNQLARLDTSLRANAPTAGRQNPILELKARVAQDQAVRVLNDAQWSKGLPPLAAGMWVAVRNTRTITIDCENTAWLRTQMQQIGWFDIPTYGTDADHDAWLLVQHADRTPDFQRTTLAQLEALPPGSTNRKNLAYLWDRIASSEGRPQRYGTQGHCVGPGTWEPNPSEDPSHLDNRRMQMGLNPEGEYRKKFKDICH
jgi:hypothetical protein